MEALVWSVGQVSRTQSDSPLQPKSIFVLRNNDLGDLLIITPLFQALRQRYPESHLVAGVGSWSTEILLHNPYISEVLPLNAPWFNRAIPHQTPGKAWRYIAASPESLELTRRQFDIGIDIFGSHWGALLLLRAGIPYRLGVKGYAGGHTVAQQTVTYNPDEQVGRSALRFAELLGATELPDCRPQIFLSPEEVEWGQRQWAARAARLPRRLVIAPGGGYQQKCWPAESYAALLQMLAQQADLEIRILGGPQDRVLGQQLASIAPTIQSLAGELSLRQTFATIAAADWVICNSSMAMHAAAAFHKPTLVLLGEDFTSTRQHQAQWGYPDTCTILGKEAPDRETIYTPLEVWPYVQQRLALTPTTPRS